MNNRKMAGDEGKNKQGGKEILNLLDIRFLVGMLVDVVKKTTTKVYAAPCDGLILHMHYRWTFWAMLTGFVAIFQPWYRKDTIVCVSHFNAEATVREEYVNVCHSYPYLVEKDGERRYILFYRWVHWSFLLLAICYYLLRKVSKNLENVKCKKLLEDLQKDAEEYEQNKVKEMVKKACDYMTNNMRTHNGLYWKYLAVNMLALLIDIFTMNFLDFVLQGRFIMYGYKSYPFDRDPQTFTDYMSQTFPPFVSCELTTDNQLVNRRTERFGCHLTIMELYEKLFLGLWLWIIVLKLFTCCYIIFLILLWLPFVRILLLRFSKPAYISTKGVSVRTIHGVLKNSKIGDVFILYRLKQYLSHAMFYEVMVKLADPSVYVKRQEDKDKDKDKDGDTNATSPDSRKQKHANKNENTKPQKEDFKAKQDEGKNKQEGKANQSLLDIGVLLGTVVGVVKKNTTKVYAAPFDGLVLHMHYRWTFWMLLGGFLAICYKWYDKNSIVCVSHFNAEATVREEYVNVCHSYPYLVEKDGERRYILFYRWVHWSFLLLAICYYLLRKVSKNLENMKCKKLLEDLQKGAKEYKEEEEMVKKACDYMTNNMRTHNGLYWKYLAVNMLALLIDIFTMNFLDFVLQGRFIMYGYKSYPFDRDPQTFTDYMSQTFPPFVSCELTTDNQLVNRRTERFGCHLTIMELYEKLFLGLWLWIIVLKLFTCCYIIFLILLWLPFVRILLLRFSKPAYISTKGVSVRTIHGVLKNSKIGDVFILYRLKQYLSHAMFYEVMVKLTDPSVYVKRQEDKYKDKDKDGDTNATSPDSRKQKHANKNENTKPQKEDFIVTFPEEETFLEDSRALNGTGHEKYSIFATDIKKFS